ncbi:MAG: TIGR04255 family protein [Aquihabitans sp.]
MEEREVYPNAPVVLVALELRHPAAEVLSNAQRLKIKRRLAAHVPIMRSAELTQIATIHTVGSPAPEIRVEEFPRYFNRSNTFAVSMRTEAIVIETTRYVRWEELRKVAVEVLKARQDVGGLDGIERVGLRYIDEIRVPGDPADGWASWVDRTLLGPASLGEELGLGPVLWQGLTAFTPGPERTIVLRYGPREGYAVDPAGDLKRSTPTPGPFFLLDVDSFWTPDNGVPEFDIETLLMTCEELHAPVRTLFERLITDRLRNEVFRHR